MRIEQDRLGQIKNYIYIGAGAVLFLTWVLSLAALTQEGGVDGRLAWVFGLCFLTIPLVIYQSLTPIWSRTARFSNVHAHCAIDGFLIILWFSAWTSLTSFVVSGKGKGKDDKQTGCDNFSHGSAAKCKISEADIFFSVIMMLCFIASGYFSFRVLMEFKRTGVAPNAAYLAGAGNVKVSKTDISYPQSYKEEEEAFDSRLNVDHGRETGYSFEETRLHGGAPYHPAYETVPVTEDVYGHEGRPTSFGGPLGTNRI